MHLLERHALYNLIRMNWLNEPNSKVEAWQVADYRCIPLDEIFHRLKNFKIHLDQKSFVNYASDYGSPEDFTDDITSDQALSAKNSDQIYLLIFEIWRRLLTDKPSLTIICNELDYQIHQHDRGVSSSSTAMQAALASFARALNDNVDQGLLAKEALSRIAPFFANDIESFFYDYIFEMIEANELYAQELLETFAPYLKDNKWFELLSVRLAERIDHKLADKKLLRLMEEYLESEDVDFNLEVLSYLLEVGKYSQFEFLALQILQFVQIEEEFQDLATLCRDFYQQLNKKEEETILKQLLKERKSLSGQKKIGKTDKDLQK